MEKVKQAVGIGRFGYGCDLSPFCIINCESTCTKRTRWKLKRAVLKHESISMNI